MKNLIDLKLSFHVQIRFPVFPATSEMKSVRLSLLVFVSLLALATATDRFGRALKSCKDVHTVERGDTLFKIANAFGVDLAAVIDANPQFEDPDFILPGQKVNIPPCTNR